MKASNPKPVKKTPPPVFQIAVRKRVGKVKAAAALKAPKRGNTFSKSRDTREDRGTREMKTSHNARSFPHAGNL